MVSIAVLDDYQQVAESLADWDALDADVTFFAEHLPDGDAVVAALAGFDLVVAMRERTPFPADVLRRLPNLRCLITTGMRNAAIDLAAAAECGITVCGTGGAGSPTSELAWALILSMFRDVAADDARVRAGGWQHGVGYDLAGQTLGLVGLGRLGRQVARVALAFDMRVLAWSEHLTDDRAAEVGVTRVVKQQLFAESRVVSLHLVLSDRSRGVVGEPELRAMRPDAFLVNTARAGLVDSAALRAVLDEGAIAHAALDVFDVEPLPADHWLRSHDRVTLSPHLGYVSYDSYRAFYSQAAEDAAAFLDGHPIRTLQ